jgi:hypothetical protein
MSSLLFDRAPDVIRSEQDGGMATGSKHAVVVEMQCLNNDFEQNGSRRYLGDTMWSSETGSADAAASGSASSTYGIRVLRAYRHRSTKKKSYKSADTTVSLPLEPERWRQKTASSSSDDEANLKRLSISGVADEQEPTVQVEVQKPIAEWRKKLSRFSKCAIVYGKKLAAFLLSTLGLAVSMVSYAILGGFIFSALESPFEVRMKASVRESLRWHVEHLWNETQRLNILHPVSHSD